MTVKEWIRQAERQGWRVQQVRGLSIELRCAKQGCEGHKALPLDNLGPTPEPCDLQHEGQYAQKVFNEYQALVSEFQRRRRSLGLSQEDVTAASGLADGHINKLEALHRVAQLPTLQLWAQTLGLSLVIDPAPLPASTLKVIEQRKINPYRPEMSRHKTDATLQIEGPQGGLFDE